MNEVGKDDRYAHQPKGSLYAQDCHSVSDITVPVHFVEFHFPEFQFAETLLVLLTLAQP